MQTLFISNIMVHITTMVIYNVIEHMKSWWSPNKYVELFYITDLRVL